MKVTRTLTLAAILLCSLTLAPGIARAADPLSSWNEGKAKQSIVEFVARATTEGSPDFVPPAERIATFDNDGTLWAERPLYFQFLFAIDRVKALAPDGRRPVAAFGNSDGDLQMLQWTAGGKGPRLCLYVHHTDAKREWAYDRKSHIGTLDKGLDAATAKGWTVVDMKGDWKQVFAFETEAASR